MNVIVLGSGGREHAIAWRLKQSESVSRLWCAPGNGGTLSAASNINIDPLDFKAVKNAVRDLKIDLVVVGPELPLAAGISDYLQETALVFGPGKAGAQIESSKLFSKQFMKRNGILTAEFETFDNYDKAKQFLQENSGSWVIKADGLAAGKGVFVTDTKEQAIEALDTIMIKNRFGAAGETVVIERKLIGLEASYIVITDGKQFLPMLSAQDHKAIYDADKGPNTGGMGAYAPAAIVDNEMEKRIQKEIIEKAIEGFKRENIEYKGVLYAGLMIVDGNPYTLEFNCRFGDPETQPQMALFKGDLGKIMYDAAKGKLSSYKDLWLNQYAVCIVAASGGYPLSYKSGKLITGIDDAERSGAVVFHAGTEIKNGKLVTNGGRVLGVTAAADTLKEAKNKAYAALAKIKFDGIYYRHDIADKALKSDKHPSVSVLMGSKSDFPLMKKTGNMLANLGISYEYFVSSAHRTPERTIAYVKKLEDRQFKIVITAAGMANHLSGITASLTSIPVIAVPVSATLDGMDALLSSVQMPPGTPVAVMSIDGAVNAALFAARIIALTDDKVKENMMNYLKNRKAMYERDNKVE